MAPGDREEGACKRTPLAILIRCHLWRHPPSGKEATPLINQRLTIVHTARPAPAEPRSDTQSPRRLTRRAPLRPLTSLPMLHGPQAIVPAARIVFLGVCDGETSPFAAAFVLRGRAGRRR